MRHRLDGGYELDDDPGRVDRDAVFAFLHEEAYWLRWRERADVERQLDTAYRCVGLYAPDGKQAGFGRVVSDGVAFGYLSDVYVLGDHRGRGLGKALVAELVATGPSWRWLLHTDDAQGLYRQVGFGPVSDRLMERPAPPR